MTIILNIIFQNHLPKPAVSHKVLQHLAAPGYRLQPGFFTTSYELQEELMEEMGISWG
jgi:hypothetical protein